MKIKLLGLLLLSLVTFANGQLLSEEEYKIQTAKATFDTLDYKDYVRIFKNKDFGAQRGSQHMHEDENKIFNPRSSDFLGFHSFASVPLPESFDWRKIYPECFTNMVRDQESCGGCWAFATVAAFSERVCIKNKGLVTTLFSTQYLISCSNMFGGGCRGGRATEGYKFIQNYSIPTDDCVPFTANNGRVQSCPKGCTNTHTKFTLTKTSGNPDDYKYIIGVEEIKQEIFARGPVTSDMTAYTDFSSYGGGVYKKSTTEVAGGHSVVILGWGVEKGEEYFIIQNSWGPDWGEKGYMRIILTWDGEDFLNGITVDV